MAPPAPARPEPGGHLLVWAPERLGDLIQAQPVLETARLAVDAPGSPWTRLSVLVRADLAPVFSGGPLARVLVPFGGGGASGRSELGAAPARDRLAELAPDAALLLTGSPRAGWRARAAGIPLRAGASVAGRGPLLTHRLVPPTRAGRLVATPTAHLLRDLAGLVGLFPGDRRPRLEVSSEGAARGASLRQAAGLAPDEPHALVCPGALLESARLWAPPRFAEAVEALHGRRGLRSLIAGAPGEERVLAAVAAAAPHGISLAGEQPDLGSLLSLVQGAALVVTGASGPRWLATALGTPCVRLFGPDAAELDAACLDACEPVAVAGLPCAPCHEDRCALDHHACMVDLPAARVVAAAERLLDA